MPRIFANGRHLFYEELGEGDPIVFLSGLGGDHRAFAVALRSFAKQYRALALDNRDVGRSDRARDFYTTGEMADDVLAWFEAIDLPPAHLVGQSLGGLVAQELALQDPAKLRSLTLVSTHACSTPWKRAVIESWVMMKRLTDAASFTRATLPCLVAPRFYDNEQIIEGLIRFAERNEWPQEPDAFARQAQAALTHQARDRLGQIRTPTLVVSGELDMVNPPDVARELVSLIPAARFEVIPGVGHLPHVEDNASLRQVIADFIEGLG